MNILLISPYFSPMVGGVETHLNDLCNFFNKQRLHTYVRTYKALGVKERGLSKERKGYINIHRFWWPDFNLIHKLESYPVLKFLYLFSGLFLDCLLFILKKNKSIDVIQAHGFIAALIAVILGKIFKKRIIVNTHVGFRLSRGIMTQIIKYTLENSDQILVLTTGIKKSLVSLGIPEDKIKIYHYWIDQKLFNIQKNAKVKLGWQKKIIVLFVGRLVEVKGIQTILCLARKIRNVTFVIVGTGPLEEKLLQETQSYSNVLFLGKINYRDLPVYYNGADLLLVPSKIIKQEYEEGIPRVIIEALFCGLPVVSTKSGGIPDVYSNKIGLLADDNLESLTQAIKRIIRRRNTRNATREYAIKVFSIKNAHIIKNSLQIN